MCPLYKNPWKASLPRAPGFLPRSTTVHFCLHFAIDTVTVTMSLVNWKMSAPASLKSLNNQTNISYIYNMCVCVPYGQDMSSEQPKTKDVILRASPHL